MDNVNSQNACLMTSSVDEEGKVHVTYVPLNVDVSVVDFFLKNGTCTNNQAVDFELDCNTEEEFWNNMWSELLEDIGE